MRTRCWCEGEHVTLYVQVENASLGGLFVRTHTPFHPGEQVKVKWEFPEVRGMHEALTKVVWKRETARSPDVPGMGLEFTGLDNRTVDALQEYITKRSGALVSSTSL